MTKAKRNTPSRRLVPLCPAAIEWLMLCPDRTDLVCSNMAMDRIREIARTAKVEKKNAAGEIEHENRFEDLADNCFRHSFISHRVASTGNVAQTALV